MRACSKSLGSAPHPCGSLKSKVFGRILDLAGADKIRLNGNSGMRKTSVNSVVRHLKAATEFVLFVCERHNK